MPPASDFKLALMRVIEPTRGPAVELLTLQDAARFIGLVRNPKSDEYRKALKGIGERLTIAKQILAREEARASHSP